MFEGFANASRVPELRKRLGFTAAALAVYRLGVAIPTPGIDGQALAQFFAQARNNIVGLVNLFSGGALERFSIFALGIMPYISASIILQLLTVVVPYLEKLSKEGELGRRKITQYTRYGTVVLSLVQSFFISMGLETIEAPGGGGVVFEPGWHFRLMTMITLTTGTAFIMWLGEQSSHLPLKINTSGVIPPIFASSLLLFPGTVTGFIDHPAARWISQELAPGTWLYNLVYVGLIIFFCYFYTAVTFNPTDVADNMKKFGGYIPGIRPGPRTAEYIDRILTRITLPGALYAAGLSVLPTILISRYNVPFYFGGTALLLVVGVALDTVAAMETHMITRSYEGFMKGGRIRGRR